MFGELFALLNGTKKSAKVGKQRKAKLQKKAKEAQEAGKQDKAERLRKRGKNVRAGSRGRAATAKGRREARNKYADMALAAWKKRQFATAKKYIVLAINNSATLTGIINDTKKSVSGEEEDRWRNFVRDAKEYAVRLNQRRWKSTERTAMAQKQQAAIFKKAKQSGIKRKAKKQAKLEDVLTDDFVMSDEQATEHGLPTRMEMYERALALGVGEETAQQLAANANNPVKAYRDLVRMGVPAEYAKEVSGFEPGSRFVEVEEGGFEPSVESGGGEYVEETSMTVYDEDAADQAVSDVLSDTDLSGFGGVEDEDEIPFYKTPMGLALIGLGIFVGYRMWTSREG